MILLGNAKLKGNFLYYKSEICFHTLYFMYVVSSPAALDLIIKRFLVLNYCFRILTHINYFYFMAFLSLYFLYIFKIIFLGFILPCFFLHSCHCSNLASVHLLMGKNFPPTSSDSNPTALSGSAQMPPSLKSFPWSYLLLNPPSPSRTLTELHPWYLTCSGLNSPSLHLVRWSPWGHGLYMCVLFSSVALAPSTEPDPHRALNTYWKSKWTPTDHNEWCWH